jgi:hypothetical protein
MSGIRSARPQVCYFNPSGTLANVADTSAF